MIEELKIYSNKKTIIFLPFSNIAMKEKLECLSCNILIINIEKENNQIIDIINKSKIEKIYIYGFNKFFNFLLPRIKETIKVCWIFNHSFSSLSEYNLRENLQYIFEYYERELISSIGCTSKENIEVFENAGYRCEYIDLKIKHVKKKCAASKTIGLLSNDYDPNNNFYNQLAALTFIENEYCKFKCTLSATKEFVKFFNIKYKVSKNIDEIMQDNFVNLYINFTNTDNEIIYKSFNLGIPCLVGNTKIFDKNKYLKEHLVIESDDDVNEIVEKIIYVKNNGEKIMNEYHKFIK